MTPGELLGTIEDADAAEPRGKRRVILEVRAPRLLGEPGKYLGYEQVQVGWQDGQPVYDSLPVYGYTRRQALRIRDAILEAARTDAQAQGEGPFDDGFGDGV